MVPFSIDFPGVGMMRAPTMAKISGRSARAGAREASRRAPAATAAARMAPDKVTPGECERMIEPFRRKCGLNEAAIIPGRGGRGKDPPLGPLGAGLDPHPIERS